MFSLASTGCLVVWQDYANSCGNNLLNTDAPLDPGVDPGIFKMIPEHSGVGYFSTFFSISLKVIVLLKKKSCIFNP